MKTGEERLKVIAVGAFEHGLFSGHHHLSFTHASGEKSLGREKFW
jgi:hypothetical protein